MVINMNLNEKILNKLISEARKAYCKGEIPVSAVIVDHNGKIVSFGRNKRQKEFNVLGHAEVIAIMRAEKKVKDWRLNNYYMYVTLEPCEMCSMIIRECRLENVFYFLKKDGKVDDFNINKNLIGGFEQEKEEFRNLLSSFFDNRR